MSFIYNAKDVARELGVTTGTIILWTKQFGVQSIKQEHALLYNDQSVNELKAIKNKMLSNVKHVPIVDVEKSINALIERIDHLEIQLAQKADDVVNVRLQQQKLDMEELNEKIELVEKQLSSAGLNNEKVKEFKPKQIEEDAPVIYSRPRRRRIMSLFGL